jgi:hypothetical protein
MRAIIAQVQEGVSSDYNLSWEWMAKRANSRACCPYMNWSSMSFWGSYY